MTRVEDTGVALCIAAVQLRMVCIVCSSSVRSSTTPFC